MRLCFRSLLLGLLGLAALFAVGLAVRRAVLEAQGARYGRPLPFTLESALEYRYVRLLAETGRLPERDEKVQVPEGIDVRRTYTIGAEYLYAAVAAWLPRAMPLDDRVRWAAAAWFCLGIPLMSLWVWAWLRSRWAAGLAGAYYAVSIGSVMRSTGQELQHEQFAMPWFLGYLACAAWARRAHGRAAWLTAAGLSAVLLGAAVAAWDLMQVAVMVWAAAGYLRFCAAPLVRRRPGPPGIPAAGAAGADRRDRAAWVFCLAVLLGAGLLNPYLRAHGFAASYAMLLAYGTLGSLLGEAGRARAGRPPGRAGPWLRALAPLALVVAGGLWTRGYSDTYGHFIGLLAAKLRFLNDKPADPALLTFDQRILWTPPLNSVSPGLTWMLFPATLPLSLLAGTIAFARCRRHPDPDIHQLLGFTILSLLAFVLFMRFHVFLSVGVSALLGWLGAWAAARRTAVRWAALVLLLAGVGAEAAQTLTRPLRWGSAPRYLEEQKALAHWLRTNTGGEPVLANFGLSAFLLAYADCPIVLHPKFESPVIRDRVREYGTALFRGTEAQFRAWMEPLGAPFYVYARGEFAPVQVSSQMRYFVNALNPAPDAAARLFEERPAAGRYFQLLWENPKYRVFRVITRSDEAWADRAADEAERALAGGRREDADRFATLALMYDPHHARALQLLLRIRPGGAGPRGVARTGR